MEHSRYAMIAFGDPDPNKAIGDYLDGKAPRIKATLRQIVREEIERSNKVA